MKQALNRRLLCIFLTSTWIGTATAQPSEEEDLALAYGDKSTISIATGNPQHISRAPAVASVITAQDIQAMGATDLDEVMETVPGVHVNRSTIANAGLYVFRGIYSTNTPQVLMLQNGIPMTTLFAGNKGNVWGGLPLENIERIEIIRGPGSALYGADAYSGVINIITRTAADIPGTEFGVRGGSFNSRDAWVQHGGKLGAMDMAAYLRVGTTDGSRQTITADAQTRNDRLFGSNASLAPGQVNNGYDAVDANLDFGKDKWRMRAGYMLRDNVGTGAGIASALDPAGKGKSERITADLSWIDPAFAQNWGAGFTASLLHYADTVPSAFVLYPPGVTFPTGTFANGMIGAPEKWDRQLRLSVFATYSGFKDHNLRAGVGHDDLNLYKTRELKNFTLSPAGVPVPIGAMVDFSNTAPFMTPHRRMVDYLYVQDEWNFARDWTLTAGVRHDNYSDFGGTTNPRLALVWDATLDLTSKLLYGRAFRAPAFVELYSINNPVQQGNPNLRPETNSTMEAAFSWKARKDTEINLSLFRYEMRDIIRAVPNTAPAVGATYNNTGKQNGHGAEVEVVWDATRTLRLTGNYAWQRSTDETTNTDAGYAPHNHVYARADWRYSNGWFSSAQMNWVADRKRAVGDTRPQVPDYTTVDLIVRSPVKNSWNYSASVRNLFNATVLEPSLAPGLIPNDLPGAPRSIWLQATYKP